MSDDIYSDCELKTIQRLEYELLLDVKKICEKEKSHLKKIKKDGFFLCNHAMSLTSVESELNILRTDNRNMRCNICRIWKGIIF